MGMFKSDPRPRVDCSVTKSRTRQSHKDSCDINFIVRQYRRTGMLTHVSGGIPAYADVSQVGSFHEVMNRVKDAQHWFEHLPAAVRSHFENDVASFMDAVADPARTEELEKLGLKKAPVKVAEPAAAAAEGEPAPHT